MIPDAAIEAAARVMFPNCWRLDPPDDLDLRARPLALAKARAAIEAAMPAIREAIAQEIDTFRESSAGRAVDTRRDAYVEAARIVRGTP